MRYGRQSGGRYTVQDFKVWKTSATAGVLENSQIWRALVGQPKDAGDVR